MPNRPESNRLRPSKVRRHWRNQRAAFKEEPVPSFKPIPEESDGNDRRATTGEVHVPRDIHKVDTGTDSTQSATE